MFNFTAEQEMQATFQIVSDVLSGKVAVRGVLPQWAWCTLHPVTVTITHAHTQQCTSQRV
jgi:hypothetical protein